MSTLLGIMSYLGGNSTLLRHWNYFLNQQANRNYILTTNDDNLEKPAAAYVKTNAHNGYIDGPALPQRMIDTISNTLDTPWDVLILTEYDTLFFHRIEVEKMDQAVAAHRAGGQTWGSRANAFYHNPWVFKREAAIKFVEKGQEAINEGVCGSRRPFALGTAEASPDVFFGYVCEQMNQPVQDNLWREYSRNSFDIQGHLEEAREAYRNGVHIIHGCKTKEQLEFITT